MEEKKKRLIPGVRVTSEFDSDSNIFFHRISCKLLDSVAKLKFSFHNNTNGEISDPEVRFVSKHLSLHYDLEENNVLLNTLFNVGPSFQFTSTHDLNSQQGHISLLSNLSHLPGYSLHLSTPLPSPLRFPKATFTFPIGEVCLQEEEEVEVVKDDHINNNLFSLNGIVKAQFLNGLCTAQYQDQDFKLRYSYKDDEMSFIPTFSLPSNALSFAFKRRLTPSDKFSYWYNCDSNYWSAVYKRTYGKDFKFKAGYDSEVRLGWASLWVGDEGGKANTAPMKMKVQFMLQVPQDDIKSSALMFRVKKRWDI
ncbi:hypothetical protein Lal_00040756 [Lupinus albus]|uniref:Uncharacterized protein n=1 Tax=Lupinus albus TaxID=3870 RepID=A0A6A4PKL3_LUPAL|nr:hypothetical protein Lalb_Chr13g0304481 [Lupinus albus]KAF1887159.1 hypothetical protein Lal_00040756 [Lupinus albus]